MKTVLFSDFLLIRRSLPQALFLAMAVGVICTFFNGASFAGAIVCAMVPVTIVFSLQLYDDQNDWSGYRLTLPINRHQVVWGRYLFMALCTIGAFLIGCVIVVGHAFFDQSNLLAQMPSATLGTIVGGEAVPFFRVLPVGLAGTYIGLIYILLLLAIVLPFLMRYGLTLAIRFIPIACCIAFLLAMVWLGDSGSAWLAWLDMVVMDGGGLLWLVIGTTVICCVLYVASAVLTAKLYAAREF